MPDEDQLFLHPAVLAHIAARRTPEDDLEFIMDQLSRLPTRQDLWRAALMEMLGGACLVQSLAFLFQ